MVEINLEGPSPTVPHPYMLKLTHEQKATNDSIL